MPIVQGHPKMELTSEESNGPENQTNMRDIEGYVPKTTLKLDL